MYSVLFRSKAIWIIFVSKKFFFRSYNFFKCLISLWKFTDNTKLTYFKWQITYSVKISEAFTNFLQVGVGKIFHSCKFPAKASSLFIHSNCVCTQFIIFMPSESADIFISRHPSLVSKPTNATAVKKLSCFLYEILSCFIA